MNIPDAFSAYFLKPDLPLTMLRVGKQTEARLHRHPFHELVIIFRGKGLHRTDTGEYAIEKGDVFLVRPDSSHGYGDTEGLELVNILYYPEELLLPDFDLTGIPGYRAFFELEPALRRHHRFKARLRLDSERLDSLRRTVGLMEAELKSDRPGSGHMAVAHFMRIKGFVARSYSEDTSAGVAPVLRIGNVLTHMDRHFNRDLRLRDLAAMASMSVSTLTRTFQRVLGMSPVNYLISIRIAKAEELLMKPDVTVTDAAYLTGFNDSNYFTRMFRKRTGVSPGAYRKLKTGN